MDYEYYSHKGNPFSFTLTAFLLLFIKRTITNQNEIQLHGVQNHKNVSIITIKTKMIQALNTYQEVFFTLSFQNYQNHDEIFYNSFYKKVAADIFYGKPSFI